MKTNKDIINEQHLGLVKNWGESAQLLSFNQVLNLMESAQKEVGFKFLIKKIFTKTTKKKITNIPNVDVINCVIETPQFLGSQKKFKMYKQSGVFYKNSLKFISTNLFGHNIQFHTLDSFQKSIVKIL